MCITAQINVTVIVFVTITITTCVAALQHCNIATLQVNNIVERSTSKMNHVENFNSLSQLSPIKVPLNCMLLLKDFHIMTLEWSRHHVWTAWYCEFPTHFNQVKHKCRYKHLCSYIIYSYAYILHICIDRHIKFEWECVV